MSPALGLNTGHATHAEILRRLTETDPSALAELWRQADEMRQAVVGDEVHLRGLIEISNHCVRRCGYCGLRVGNRALRRYRMDEDDILACARHAQALSYGTVVLQAGEDPGLETHWVTQVVRRIKSETGLAVTLSLGERDEDELRAWRAAGADRYLLRFETSDEDLYRRIHPPLPGGATDRIALLRRLREFGYEIGSGIMVGIPGQTFTTVAHDIEVFADLDLDMIGIGPYIAHPATPLGDGRWAPPNPLPDQVPGDETTVCKVLALTRLACPEANLPSTTALATINKTSGRETALQRGANVIMPNLTPPHFRELYEIYPDKACLNETADMCGTDLPAHLAALGRRVGVGPGGRRREG
ncbi:MAG: [FeFe] hydrogenase H-cluster radical SAM maturase HydE [Thermoleophilia bacterium]